MTRADLLLEVLQGIIERSRVWAPLAADRLATDVRRLFDAPQRPAQSPQRRYLLFFVVAQDVAHPQRWTGVPLVGVNVSVVRPDGRFSAVDRFPSKSVSSPTSRSSTSVLGCQPFKRHY